MPADLIQKNRPGVHRLKLDSHSAWLYGAPGRWLLVDAGTKRTAPRLMEALEKAGCKPSEIALIVVTHGHYDHVGAIASLLKEANIPVLIHARDAAAMSRGTFFMSDGFRPLPKIGAWLMRRLACRLCDLFEPFEAALKIEAETRLDAYGFKASVIPTPGHSAGSISVLTDDGVLFAGDLAVNRPYPGVWRHMSLFGDSEEEIKKQWKILLGRGAKKVCPGHSEAFAAEELRTYLQR